MQRDKLERLIWELFHDVRREVLAHVADMPADWSTDDLRHFIAVRFLEGAERSS